VGETPRYGSQLPRRVLAGVASRGWVLMLRSEATVQSEAANAGHTNVHPTGFTSTAALTSRQQAGCCAPTSVLVRPVG
jgi:hypothetical protein